MVQAPDFLTQLVRVALGRNHTADAGDTLASSEPSQDIASGDQTSEAPSPSRDGSQSNNAADFDPGIVGVLAEKVLLAWLRNRYQLLFPFALDLRRLDEQKATLLIHAMIAAAQADGSFDGKERQRIEGTLNLVDPKEDERGFLEAVVSQPKPLYQILSEVHDVQTGALVYAASLMAVDQRKPVNRYYLKYLAARLQLSEELVGSLEQRYRSST